MIVSKTRSIRFTSNENLKKNIGEIKNIIDSYSCITIIEDSIFGVSEENFGQPLTLTFTIEVSSDEELEIDLWRGLNLICETVTKDILKLNAGIILE